MYHYFDRKNQLFIMRYMPSHLHKILWSKMPSGGGFISRPLSHLQHGKSHAPSMEGELMDVLATCDTSMGKVMHLPWKVNSWKFWKHVTQVWEKSCCRWDSAA